MCTAKIFSQRIAQKRIFGGFDFDNASDSQIPAVVENHRLRNLRDLNPVTILIRCEGQSSFGANLLHRSIGPNGPDGESKSIVTASFESFSIQSLTSVVQSWSLKMQFLTTNTGLCGSKIRPIYFKSDSLITQSWTFGHSKEPIPGIFFSRTLSKWNVKRFGLEDDWIWFQNKSGMFLNVLELKAMLSKSRVANNFSFNNFILFQ